MYMGIQTQVHLAACNGNYIWLCVVGILEKAGMNEAPSFLPRGSESLTQGSSPALQPWCRATALHVYLHLVVSMGTGLCVHIAA